MKIPSLPILSLLLLLAAIDASADFSRLDALTERSVDDSVAAFMEETRAVGLSIGIVVDGEIVFLKGYGFADREAGVQATERTLYRLGSVSKSITGILAMQLVEEGLLDLSEDVRRHVPEYPEKGRGVMRVGHLLRHQSGIVHYDGRRDGQYCTAEVDTAAQRRYIEEHPDRYDAIAALEIFRDQPICFAPGEHFQYTTWGYSLLGALLERVAGDSYEYLLYRRIVLPLGLPTLQPEFRAFRPYPNEASGYERFGTQTMPSFPTIDLTDVSYKLPGGGLIGSVVDLALVMKGLVKTELFSATTLDLFGEVGVPRDGDSSSYGYGIWSGHRNGQPVLWHSGSQSKTATLFYFSPESRNGIVVMSNTRGINLYPLVDDIYPRLDTIVVIDAPPFYPDPPRLARFRTEIDIRLDQGESYEGYTEPGTYIDTLVSSIGCDSIRVVRVEVGNRSDPTGSTGREE